MRRFPPQRYGRLARLYPWLEYALFGLALERARAAALPPDLAPRRVLLLGEGDGRGLAAALRRWPEAEFTVVDASVRMLRRARLHVGSATAARVRWLCADVADLHLPPTAYDLVMLHFLVDNLAPADARTVVARAQRAVRPGGWLHYVDFVPLGRLQRWRTAARGLHTLMYGFFALTIGLGVHAVPETGVAEEGTMRSTGLGGLVESVGRRA